MKIVFLSLSACLLLSCANRQMGSSSDIPSEGTSASSSLIQSESYSSGEHSSSTLDSSCSSVNSSSSSNSSSISSKADSSYLSSENNSSLSSSSQEIIEEIKGISLVKEQCLNIEENVNEAGYAVSSKVVTIEAKVLTASASNCTKQGYGITNPYKALVVDKTGYMYAALSQSDYLKLKDYVGLDTTVYRLKGRLGLYYEEPELVVDEIEWLNKTSDDLPSLSDLPLLDLASIKEEIGKLPISIKGFSYGRPIRLRATYFDELVEETLLFGDGGGFIQVHGSNKISNQFKKGETYEIAVTLQTYLYKPSLEFIALISRVDDIHYTFPLSPQKRSAAEQYAIKADYKSETARHNETYENDFYSVYSFTGYVSTYQKSGSYYFALTDSLRSNEFTSLENARDGKALFVNNKSEKAISKESDLRYSSLYPYYSEGKKVKVTYSPYMYNTQSYWMVFCHFSTLIEADSPLL